MAASVYWDGSDHELRINTIKDEAGTGAPDFPNGITGAGVGGRKNYLINGDFKKNLRVYVSGAATTTTNQYILDRWYIPTLGESATFSTTNGIVTVTAPASGIAQKIENTSNNGGTMTVSYGGTAALTVAESTDNVTYTSVTVANNTFTATPGNYIKITLSGGTVSLAKVQDGPVATDGWHPYDGELGGEVQACSWYLKELNLPAFNTNFYGVVTAGGFRCVIPSLGAKHMRVLPTIIYTNGAITGTLRNASSTVLTSTEPLTISLNNVNGYISLNGSVYNASLNPAFMMLNETRRVLFDAEL
jgi:hypothetical protein